MRYNTAQILPAFLGVECMQESTTYQWIIQQGIDAGLVKGKAEGKVETRRETLLAVLHERFGIVPAELEQRIINHPDADALFTAIRQAVHIERIDDLNEIVTGTSDTNGFVFRHRRMAKELQNRRVLVLHESLETTFEFSFSIRIWTRAV